MTSSQGSESLDRALADLELLQAAYPDEVRVGTVSSHSDKSSSNSAYNNNTQEFPLFVTLTLEEGSSITLEWNEGYPITSGVGISSYRSSQKDRIDAVARNVRQAAQESLEDQMEGALVCCSVAMETWMDHEHIREEEAEDAAMSALTSGIAAVTTPVVSRHHEWISGEPLLDRKSTFIAHACRVSTELQVKEALYQLISSSNKIQRASHNMYAWRVKEVLPDGAIVPKHDNDDDGEDAAGSRLAQLLHMRDEENVLVVVSRWFGGIHLGPKRFAHITNAARDILVHCHETVWKIDN